MSDHKQNNAWGMLLRLVSILVIFSSGPAIAAPEVSAKQLYQKLCSVCHGDRGDGDSRAAGSFNPRPRDFTAPTAITELTRERMIRSVAEGRPGTAMVGHAKKLSPQQIESVVDYIRTTFMHLPSGGQGLSSSAKTTDLAASKVTPSPGKLPGDAMNASADMNLPLPQKLKGNVESGRAFFMKNCFTCHGVKGDGNGPRAYFITPRPRNFTSEESRQTYNRPRLFDAISNGKRGTVMPAWGKVLTEQQIANVAEFVFQAYIKGSYKLNVPETLPEDGKKKAH